MVTRQRLTVEQYLALPEEKPYLEYIDGEAKPKVAPDFSHMVLVQRISDWLSSYRAAHGGISGPEGRIHLGEGDDTRFLLPDIAYWAADRPVRGQLAMQPPSIAFEVRSPGQSLQEMREKAEYYVSHGVPECWIIDPLRSAIDVFSADAPPATYTSAVVRSRAFPGLELKLDSLFELPEA